MELNIWPIDFIREENSFNVRLEILEKIFPKKQWCDLKDYKVLDLGSGHGKFSLFAKNKGIKSVTSVDARGDRFPDERGIAWIKEDVRKFDCSGYNLILNLGLFYHLGLNDQIALLKKCNYCTNILDTHVYFAKDYKKLKEIKGCNDEIYYGDYYQEEKSLIQLRKRPTGAWGNLKSFWHTEYSLIKLFQDCGFKKVTRVVPNYYPNRTFYILIP